jgi:periplasmic mercuric ion binding protein
MRSPIYLLAALAAAGIAYYVASAPVSTPTGSQAANADTVVATETASAVMDQPGTLVLRVEDMHCEFACFPKVKKTLEGFDGVVSVALDEQAEEGTLDNPQVVVTYESGFDLGAAQGALAKRGFAKSSVVQ